MSTSEVQGEQTRSQQARTRTQEHRRGTNECGGGVGGGVEMSMSRYEGSTVGTNEQEGG
jgi:hypothetical protein